MENVNQTVVELFKSFLRTIVFVGLDLTKILKLELANAIEITPLVIGQLESVSENEYSAPAVFLIEAKGAKEIAKGEVKIKDSKVYVVIGSLTFEVDSKKLE